MEIGAKSNLSNLSFSQSSPASEQQPQRPNAFGIGSANRPEVELSPQARILQQNEQNANNLREGLQQQDDSASDENNPALAGNDYVRVSSSVGSAARNNLTAEQAAEVYQSIQDLL